MAFVRPDIFSRDRPAPATLRASSIPEPPGAPLVSVIMPTFNRPGLLCAAIDSVLDQTLSNLEILVVNDGGIDVAGLVGGRADDDRVRLLAHPANRGMSAARNTGLRAARGRYVAYLDDDDRYDPDHLATLVAAAESSGNALVYGDAREAVYAAHDAARPVRREIRSADFAPHDLLVINRVPILCVLHRRACLDEVGLFDESLLTHEDWDLWIRLFHRFPYTHVRRTTCEYRRQERAPSVTNDRRPDFHRTMKIVHRRYRHLAWRHPRVPAAQWKQRARLARECRRIGHPVDVWGRLRHALDTYLRHAA